MVTHFCYNYKKQDSCFNYFRFPDITWFCYDKGASTHYFLSSSSKFWKKMCPERTKKYEREIRIAMGHLQTAQYIAAITV